MSTHAVLKIALPVAFGIVIRNISKCVLVADSTISYATCENNQNIPHGSDVASSGRQK